MKKALILFAALLLTACTSHPSEESRLSEPVQSNTSVESSVPEVSNVQSSDTDSQAQSSDTTEQVAHDYIPNLIPVDEAIIEKDSNGILVGISRYFALFDDWPEEEKAGLEMPYSMQWIMPYIQFDVDLYEYMRASERYPEWQKYEMLWYQDGREYQQTLYEVIRFFDISREEFGKMYGDNIIPDTEWRERCQTGHVAVCGMSESMVDALFSDDEYLRNSTFCAKESAFVAADGEVYSGFWMLYNTPAEALESASFTPEELTRFVETMRVPFNERAESEISADYANYAMAEPLVEFVEEWYAEYMALADSN